MDRRIQAPHDDAEMAADRRFALFMDHSPAFSFLVDSEDRLVWVNQTFLSWLDRDRDAVLGVHPDELHGPGAAEQFAPSTRQVLDTGQPLSVEQTLQLADGSTMHLVGLLTRAVLAVLLSGLVATGGLELYPAALGVLVASKAYGVVRSAVVPRLLPPRFSLVKANSRVTLAGLLATGVAAPIAVGLQQVGHQWPLYGACALFLLGTFWALRMPSKVDSAKGERSVRILAHREKRPTLRSVGPSVLHGLQANAAFRMLSGFLIFFLAFLLREHPLDGQSAALSMGIVGVAAGTGNALGTAIGAWLKARAPEMIIATVQGMVLTAAIMAAIFFGAGMVAVLAATAGLCQALAKLSLDATIQRDVPEEIRTSAFARSETLLQMSWVVGGAIGIVLPLHGVLGMSMAAAIVFTGATASVRGLLNAAHGGGNPRPRVA